jgi:quercetin dioxygenase-like cupin family protein
MKSIELLAHLSMSSPAGMAKDLEVNELLNGPFGRILEIRLQNGAILKRHKADEPITVLCLSGGGVFRAGADLEDSQEMVAGTFITLEAGIEHEFAATPAGSILVTRFKPAHI